MLRRFAPSSSSALFLATSSRFCSSSSSSASTTHEQSKKFDPREWAKEQERRRQTEPRKAFWTPSGDTNLQKEVELLQKRKEALLEQERRLQQEVEENQKRQQIWGRDTIELVENVQQAANTRSASPLSSAKGGFSGIGSITERMKQQQQTQTQSSSQQQSNQNTQFAQQQQQSSSTSQNNPLRSRLDSLYKNYASKDSKAQEAQDAILNKRKEQLQWREIDYQLDQVRLDRDFLQWYHYVKYGNEYAIDCELERELRYFPEHVAAELKKNLKFMTGSSRLVKTGPAFPTITKLTKLSTILDKATTGKKGSYEEDTLTQNSFKMPTVVFISQLAHGSDSVEDIDRYYVPLVREAVSNPHGGGSSSSSASTSSSGSSNNNSTGSPKKKAQSESFLQQMMNKGKSGNKKTDKEEEKSSSSAAASAGVKSEKPEPQKATARDVVSVVNELVTDTKYQGKFDFMYLKTADFQSSIWLRKWLTKVHATRINSALAPRSYVGVRLLRNFSPTLGLRNYGAQYVLLIDHQGRVRWMSTGPPTSDEVEWFTEHCRTLMKQHTIAKAK